MFQIFHIARSITAASIQILFRSHYLSLIVRRALGVLLYGEGGGVYSSKPKQSPPIFTMLFAFHKAPKAVMATRTLITRVCSFKHKLITQKFTTVIRPCGISISITIHEIHRILDHIYLGFISISTHGRAHSYTARLDSHSNKAYFPSLMFKNSRFRAKL